MPIFTAYSFTARQTHDLRTLFDNAATAGSLGISMAQELRADFRSSLDFGANAAVAEVNVKTSATTASVFIFANAVVNTNESTS